MCRSWLVTSLSQCKSLGKQFFSFLFLLEARIQLIPSHISDTFLQNWTNEKEKLVNLSFLLGQVKTLKFWQLLNWPLAVQIKNLFLACHKWQNQRRMSSEIYRTFLWRLYLGEFGSVRRVVHRGRLDDVSPAINGSLSLPLLPRFRCFDCVAVSTSILAEHHSESRRRTRTNIISHVIRRVIVFFFVRVSISLVCSLGS